MYNKDFAKIYNQEWVNFSKKLADNVLKTFPESLNSVLDLGCGTGNFLKKLEKRFEKLVGIDISKDMIEVAKTNSQKARFFVKSITDFDLNEKFDLITCNFDTINHLQSITDWQKVFELAFKHLNDGGVFLFDVNTPFKYSKLVDEAKFYTETENYNIVDKARRIDENHIEISIEVFNKSGKKLASICEIESLFDEKLIQEKLNEVGFSDVVFADMELNPVDNFEKNRFFIICKK